MPVLCLFVRWLRTLQRLLAVLVDGMERYHCSVTNHQESVAIPFLFDWMMETLEYPEFDGEKVVIDSDGVETVVPIPSDESVVVKAINHVITIVGHRKRTSIDEEAIARQIRKTLVEYGMPESSIPYWSELGLNMYFNPPYSTKAVVGKFEGFQ